METLLWWTDARLHPCVEQNSPRMCPGAELFFSLCCTCSEVFKHFLPPEFLKKEQSFIFLIEAQGRKMNVSHQTEPFILKAGRLTPAGRGTSRL